MVTEQTSPQPEQEEEVEEQEEEEEEEGVVISVSDQQQGLMKEEVETDNRKVCETGQWVGE